MSAPATPSIRSPQAPPEIPTSASLPFYYFVYLVIVLIPAGMLLAFFLFVAPSFKEIFKDFKTTLPTFTELTLVLADLVQSGLWVPILLSALALPALLAWITIRQPYRLQRVMYVLIALILMLTFNMICGALEAAAFFLPLIKLIQSVSGGGGGP